MKITSGPFVAASFLLASVAMADIASPTLVQCEVTKVTPVKARFFSHNQGIVVGDQTQIDFGASEIAKIKFKSNAVIGATIHPHPLLKQVVEAGMSRHTANFVSKTNLNSYTAKLNAFDGEAGTVLASLDVLEEVEFSGRMNLNSLELNCKR